MHATMPSRGRRPTAALVFAATAFAIAVAVGSAASVSSSHDDADPPLHELLDDFKPDGFSPDPLQPVTVIESGQQLAESTGQPLSNLDGVATYVRSYVQSRTGARLDVSAVTSPHDDGAAPALEGFAEALPKRSYRSSIVPGARVYVIDYAANTTALTFARSNRAFLLVGSGISLEELEDIALGLSIDAEELGTREVAHDNRFAAKAAGAAAAALCLGAAAMAVRSRARSRRHLVTVPTTAIPALPPNPPMPAPTADLSPYKKPPVPF